MLMQLKQPNCCHYNHSIRTRMFDYHFSWFRSYKL